MVVNERDTGLQAPPRIDDDWQLSLDQVAEAASRGAGDVPVELLGQYLRLLTEAARSGREPSTAELETVEALGRRAAELGVSAGHAVQLYLSAAWRLWKELARTSYASNGAEVSHSAEVVLRVVDRAVAHLAEGYTVARRDMVRREETQRRELIEDLLRGDGDVGALMARAEPFGMDMARPHQVALAAPTGRLADAQPLITALERAAVYWLGDRDILVASKDTRIVIIAPADAIPAPGRTGSTTTSLATLIHTELTRHGRGLSWRVSQGRAYPGSYGIARSYEEARDGLTMATRLRLHANVIHPEELLTYRVLLRDQPAIVDLVETVLSPLTQARGGAHPLLTTLDAYFDTGGTITETARRLHLSVRAVTYRLDRITALTGYDPTSPRDRFTMHAATLGARLLGWPDHNLTTTPCES